MLVEMADGSQINRRSGRVYLEDGHCPTSDKVAIENASDTASSRSSIVDRDERHLERGGHTRQSSITCDPVPDLMNDYFPDSKSSPHNEDSPTASVIEGHNPSDERPLNFGMVLPGLYRSAFPRHTSYEFLKSLGLKTIVTLVRKDHPPGFDDFISANGIRHVVFDMAGTKKVNISQELMLSIMSVVLDQSDYPMLMHCNHGKHRTGCVVAILRRAYGWESKSAIDEYLYYASDKYRDEDVSYIGSYDTDGIKAVILKNSRAARIAARKWKRIGAYAILVATVSLYLLLSPGFHTSASASVPPS